MTRHQVGEVSALWRYPVKSMRGEPLVQAIVTENGLNGDRFYAVRELRSGGFISARRLPQLLKMRAVYESEPQDESSGRVLVEFPDGSRVPAEDREASELLSSILGLAVRLEPIRTSRLTADEIEAIAAGKAFAPRRDFFDEDVLHVLATGTLKHLQRLRGEGSHFDARRFRPNIVVDTGDDDDGFVEDRWLNGVLEAGESVRIVGMRPAIRCAMTTHPQEELPRDPIILRTAWEYHAAYVGIFAAVGSVGVVRVGDRVFLVN